MKFDHHSRTFVALATAISIWAAPGFAQSEAVLRVAPKEAPGDTIALDLATLDALPQVTFTTSTIWTDGPVTFSGVALKTLLSDVIDTATAVEMVALNDYSVTISPSQIEDGVPIVATRMNGDVMSVREKGPFWVVFPYDSDPKYRSETIYALSIWQLECLKIVD